MGFFTLIGWILAELVGGIGAGWVAGEIANRVLPPSTSGLPPAAIIALVIGGLVIFLLERRCRRKYGEGPLNLLQFPQY